MSRVSLLESLHRPARVSAEERYLFLRQLHILQKAGVPLLAALQGLEGQLHTGTLKRALRDVWQDLLNGHALSAAFGRRPETFDPLFVSLLRVGEAGGLLDVMLERLAKLAEWDLDLRAKLRQAFQYPMIVVGILAVALGLMVTFVLPRFGQMFSSMHVALPLQTRLLLATSRFLVAWGWLLGLGLVAAVVVGWRWLQTEPGRGRWDRAILRIPVLGPLCLQLAMSRFARVVSVLNASGVPMFETLALAGQSVNNRYVQQCLARVHERIKAGEGFAKALQADSLFPPIVVQMAATGEQTGQMEQLLASVSDYYDQQVAYLLRRLLTALEPALLVVVAVGVLVMASAVLVPMWDMVKLFNVGR